jgi:Tfp pilus assembly protein PilV
MTHRQRMAFTLIEVLAMLLVLAIGLSAVIGMLLYATRRADDAQMLQLANATAMTVAYDPTPLLEPAAAAGWSSTPLAMQDATSIEKTVVAKGYINGLYVIRNETAAKADISAQDAGSGDVFGRLTRVHVSVFSQSSGSELTSYSCLRFVRLGKPAP